MRCQCFIIPSKVLNRFARDKTLTASERKSFADAALFENQWRTGRTAHGKVAVAALAILARGALQVGPPLTTVNMAPRCPVSLCPRIPRTPPRDER
jgi:hypothetical protein